MTDKETIESLRQRIIDLEEHLEVLWASNFPHVPLRLDERFDSGDDDKPRHGYDDYIYWGAENGQDFEEWYDEKYMS